VRDTPSGLFSNRFACLAVDNEPESLIESVSAEVERTEQKITDVSSNKPPRTRTPRWERRLPNQMTICADSTMRQVQLEVEVQTTDTARTFRLSSLLDSGASGLFIDKEYVARHAIPTRKLSRPIPVLNVDGTPNEAGAITDVISMILKYGDHTERTTFAVTSLGRQDMILGLLWLRQHNPEVDWQTRQVAMTCCDTRCQTCKTEIRQIAKERRKDLQARRMCKTGPFPSLTEEEEKEEKEEEEKEETEEEEKEETEEEEKEETEEEEKEDSLERGDRILATVLHPEPTQINATATISQRLAEAAAKEQTSVPISRMHMHPGSLRAKCTCSVCKPPSAFRKHCFCFSISLVLIILPAALILPFAPILAAIIIGVVLILASIYFYFIYSFYRAYRS
jgi:hypothetical protein